MKTELAVSQAVHLPDAANIRWSEPQKQEGCSSWTVDLVIASWPNGHHSTTFFGTEAQVREIAGGYRAAEEVTTDPAQLDALEEAAATPDRPPMTDIGAHIFELGGYLNKIATVASW